MQNMTDNLHYHFIGCRRLKKEGVTYRDHLRDQHLLGPGDEPVVYRASGAADYKKKGCPPIAGALEKGLGGDQQVLFCRAMLVGKQLVAITRMADV